MTNFETFSNMDYAWTNEGLHGNPYRPGLLSTTCRIMKSSLKPGEGFQSFSCKYQIQCILGSGVYGEVALCRNLTNNQMVALKVLSGPYALKSGRHEVKILQTITAQGSQVFPIVRWLGSFESTRHFFHEFEKLDISLTQFLNKSPNGRLQVWETRPLICQMVEALEFLQRVGIMHCDLKPDNIMMINHVEQPLRIKIIDFGLACSVNKASRGKEVQTLHYRAPETILRSSVHVAIDMWSVGCIAAQMVLGHVLFPATNEKMMMKFIVETVGQPPKSCLDQGLLTSTYYCWSEHKQMWEYKRPFFAPILHRAMQLDHIFMVTTTNASADHDRVHLLHLLKQMLDPNPETRITPEEVFKHPFIRMSHLEDCEPAYFVQSVRILSQTWRRKRLVNPTPAAQPTKAPPTTAASQGQRTNKRKAKEQESPSKKRRLNEDISEHRLVNPTPAAQPTKAPPTTAASQGQGTNKRKAKEQDSPSKKRRLNEDISEHRSNKARKRARDTSESFPSKKMRTSTISTRSSRGQHGIPSYHGLQSHLVIVTTPTSSAVSSSGSSSNRGKRNCEEDLVDQTSLPTPKQRRITTQNHHDHQDHQGDRNCQWGYSGSQFHHQTQEHITIQCI